MEGGLLFDTMIYLAAAVIIVPISKRIGLGSVLGYLLAGVIIGPFLLGFIGEEGEDLMHFAEFGVVMMLFLVGLELEPRLLWRLRTPILGMGGLQVLLSTLLIGGIALGFDFSWQQSLAIGMTFALSSTAIVLQTLGEKGLLGSAGGQGSFAVLLFQDIAVIPILAVMPLLATAVIHHADDHGGSSSILGNLSGGMQALVTLFAVALVVLVGRYLVPKLMSIVVKTHQRELLTGAALLLVVSVAVLMSAVGLSPALGTFLGGVVLANSPYRHELESDLEPFKGLLLGLFFMAVGASIDFRLIAENPGLILGLTALLLLAKGSVLFGIGKVFKLSLDQNLLFAFGLCQTGEFAFVLLSVIRQQEILSVEIVGILLVVVAISMAATPLLVLVNERLITPRVGTTTIANERPADDMNQVEEGRKVIIAGFDTFGVVASRFLAANGIKATILEADSDRVELLRRMGFEVYYGDPTRFDLLKTAGAAEAEAIIIGLRQPEKNLALVETVKKHFPKLRLMVRAFDYTDTYDLMDAGVLHIHRESIQAGVSAATETLKQMGFRSYQLERRAKRFIAQDKAALQSLAAVRHDDQTYVDAVRSRVTDIESQLASELNPNNVPRDLGWDSRSLRDEFGG